MTNIRYLKRTFLPALFLAMFPPGSSLAKRSAPATVEPVVYRGVRYVAPNDDGRRAHIEAWDVQTNKKLWDLTIFTNPIDPKMEEDVQWVFINRLVFRDGTLFVVSERGNTYQVDLNTKAITLSDPAVPQAPSTSPVPNDTPESIKRAINNGLLPKEYELFFRVKPFYLGGDFDADGKVDVAALVKQRSSGKLGIAIIHGAPGKVTILGAGNAIGNGGDDFDWMDSWKVYSKGTAIGGKSVPKLHGDALFVSKNEAASALIYWNGKRYVWLQQGD
jgi:hypothetical protein